MAKTVSIINKTQNKLIADKVVVADNYWLRLKGLLGKKQLLEGEGLWLKPCNSVHMFFMQMPLDVVFLDKDNKVIHLIENLKPWQVSPVVKGAKSVLELSVGCIAIAPINLGDCITL